MNKEKPTEPEKWLEKEELTPAKAHDKFKDALFNALGKTFPGEFDSTKNVLMQTDAEGNLKLKQYVGKVERNTGKEFHPEEKYKEYTFAPEDSKKCFEKLDPEAKEIYLEGLQESVDMSERILESGSEEENLTEQEEKDLEEERQELEATKKLIENLRG